MKINLVSLGCARNLVDSEVMLGRFLKHGWFGGPSTLPPDRKRWTSVLNRFKYPCWLDKAGRGYFQPMKKVLTFEGPAIVVGSDSTLLIPPGIAGHSDRIGTIHLEVE